MGFLIEKSGIIWKSLLNCCKYTKGMLYRSYERYQITKNKQGGKGMFKKVVSAIMVAAMVGTMVALVNPEKILHISHWLRKKKVLLSLNSH